MLASNVEPERWPAALPLGAWAGVRAARALDRRRAAAEGRAIAATLPAFLERVNLCVLSGMSIERALRAVAPSARGPLAAVIGDGVRSLDAGMPRPVVYARIARASDDLGRVARALARAERDGSSVAAVLRAHAAELRTRERIEAEARARGAGVATVFPLVLCFLPAFVLLTIAPIAIGAFRTIGGI